MLVRQIMLTPVITVDEDCSLEEAAKMMLDRNVGGLPVVDDRGELCGIVTESDFVAREKGIPFSLYRFPQMFGEWMPHEHVERIYEAARRRAVREIMSREVITVTEVDTIETVLEKMLKCGLHRLPVVRDRKPVGIVTRHDLLRLMLRQWSGTQVT
ncbi:MAG TPA: CBS domain-containing protein [Terriglobia bacterium]|nr:CBS domain-containing protein [Terriglobia bacterium]